MEINRLSNTVQNVGTTLKERVNASTTKKPQQTEVDNVKTKDLKKEFGVSHAKLNKPIKDTVEISKQAMTEKFKQVKANKSQDNATVTQKEQDIASQLVEHGQSLMELASKHQASTGKDKEAVTSKIKDVLDDVKKTINSFDEKKSKLPKKLVAISSNIEKLDLKAVLNKETIEKEIVHPAKELVKKSASKLDDMTNSLRASQAGLMVQAEVKPAMNKLKEVMKSDDVQKVSSNLDGRRTNVSYLLR